MWYTKLLHVITLQVFIIELLVLLNTSFVIEQDKVICHYVKKDPAITLNDVPNKYFLKFSIQ